MAGRACRTTWVLGTILAWALAAHADFDRALNRAMASYYAALLASHRGDAESTQRHLMILAARWEQVAKMRPPEPLGADPAWPDALERIRAVLRRSQALVRARQLEAAHLELEGLRLVLREVRGRHGLVVFDDHLTDYHEAMERIAARASMQNEIVLTEADYAELEKDLARARSRWAAVERDAGVFADTPGWSAAARRVADLHAELARHLGARDRVGLGRAAGDLRLAYHQLLEVLARVRRD